MPSGGGLVQVVTVDGSGILNIGDVYKIAPITGSKVFTGAGSFNTCECLGVTNYYSNTNTYDHSGIDQPTLLNL